jgi:pantoate--beta-alanine ligase
MVLRVIKSIQEMREYSNLLRMKNLKIGFVPTMGFLHEGHLSLVKKAKELSDVCIVSIFINPTQFNEKSDLESYPRDFERDKQLLREEGVDAIFYPDAGDIYTETFQTYVNVTELTKKFEGEFRPSHFQGVTTIVSILFNIVEPHLAVFGQKDAQQAVIIKKMVDDLKMNIKIIIAPIVREKDGLAMSSRNFHLSEKEREDALVLSRSLNLANEKINSGERKTNKIIAQMKKLYDEVETAKLEYISIVEEDSFDATDELMKDKNYYVLIACRIGKTRLIDNAYIIL